jgi:cysteinyl-tRNA synthetase
MIEVPDGEGPRLPRRRRLGVFQDHHLPRLRRLSRIKERELKITNAVADADHKDSVSDFALWKAYKPEEDGDVKWPGPRGAGEGRPGWHIECSAMSKSHLGDTIDLHTGGVDLLFPHHENEIAQSQCCNGTTFARHWYHSEHLLVDGTTMSKSKGNYYTLRDLVAKGYCADGRALRPALRATRASSSTSPSTRCTPPRARLKTCCAPSAPSGRRRTIDIAARAGRAAGRPEHPGALGALFGARQPTPLRLSPIARLRPCPFRAGPRPRRPRRRPRCPPPAEITALADKRWAAKQAKDFATADACARNSPPPAGRCSTARTATPSNREEVAQSISQSGQSSH